MDAIGIQGRRDAAYYFVTPAVRNLTTPSAFAACIREASYKKRIDAKQTRVGRSVAMSKREIGMSPALDRRIADLKARMRNARITEYEMKTFQRVASIMGAGEGSMRLDADDLIAASFVVDALGEPTPN